MGFQENFPDECRRLHGWRRFSGSTDVIAATWEAATTGTDYSVLATRLSALLTGSCSGSIDHDRGGALLPTVDDEILSTVEAAKRALTG